IMYSYDKFGIIRVQARQGDDNYDLKIAKEPVPPMSEMIKYGEAPSKSKLKTDVPYKIVTFSNTEWETYDNKSKAEHLNDISGGYPLRKHVIKNKSNIKFVGYNVSSMDEGVFIILDQNSNFEIECNIDTSTIQDHPGGHVNIELGIINAQLTENGGNILLDGKNIKKVGSKFNIKMVLKNGKAYEVYINNALVGSKEKEVGVIKVKFGLEHGGHACARLSEAEISNIHMAIGGGEADSYTEPWELSAE
ncbi:MAG: hypothetical protein FWH48_00140, partial [Oscillospiraceae bacterium]|nr:hypothetical protein [Oscillospiraceae bacterium]